MPSFTNTLIGVVPICDADYTVIFTKKDVTVILPNVKAILTGWREKKLPRLWHFALKPTEKLIKDYTTTIKTTPTAHSVYDPTIVEALVQYMHAAAGFPIKPTWFEDLVTWPGLAYSNAAKYVHVQWRLSKVIWFNPCKECDPPRKRSTNPEATQIPQPKPH